MIYLVRHPETNHNAGNMLTGWQKSEYTKMGESQFAKIAEYFGDKKLDVISSDLPRALMLGNKIASITGGSVAIDKALRERNFKETPPMDSFEDDDAFRRRIFDWIDNNEISDVVLVSHEGTVDKIILKLIGSDFREHVGTSRDVIFKIETVKNENKLSVIQT